MTGIYQMRETFELKEYNTAITRADFEAHFTKTAESVQFTFNGWDGKSYDGESRKARVYRTSIKGYEKEETIENLQELIETVCQIDYLGAEQERLEQELRIIAENLANLIQKNASVALDQTEQAEKEKKLRTLYGEKHSRFLELESLIQEKNDTREILTNFITKLEDLTGEQTEFRDELWGGLVDHIRIDEKSSTVVFRGEIEITI